MLLDLVVAEFVHETDANLFLARAAHEDVNELPGANASVDEFYGSLHQLVGARAEREWFVPELPSPGDDVLETLTRIRLNVLFQLHRNSP